jgi:hypothetical protein
MPLQLSNVGQRSPPVVSTAFLVPGTHFSVTRYPRIANLEVVLLR